jgi:hypothetical protein
MGASPNGESQRSEERSNPPKLTKTAADKDGSSELCGSPNGRSSLSTDPFHTTRACRGAATNINKAVAAILSQNGHDDRLQQQEVSTAAATRD